MRTDPQKPASFRRQLAVTVAASTTVILLASAIATAFLVFEPFQQADMGDTREHGGVGLGLAITKRFCEMLGGSIDVQSEEHVGSTFRVTIPLPMETGRE